jgi:hypothetical protein
MCVVCGNGRRSRPSRGVLRALLFAWMAWAGSAAHAAAGTFIYAVTENNELQRIEVRTPAPPGIHVHATVPITGLAAGEDILAIDFSPIDGQLYGVSDANRLYRLHMTTAVATPIGALPFTPALAGTQAGAAFDQDTGHLHVVTAAGQHLVLDPVSGGATALPDTVGLIGLAFVTRENASGSGRLYGIDTAGTVGVLAGGTTFTPDGRTVNVGGGPFGFDIVGRRAIGYFYLHQGDHGRLVWQSLTDSGPIIPIDLGETAALRDIAVASTPVTLYASGIQGPADEQTLFRFNSANPFALQSVAITGLAPGEFLRALGVRTVTGDLFGLGAEHLHRIDVATGQVVESLPVASIPAMDMGLDYNAGTDTFRVSRGAPFDWAVQMPAGTVTVPTTPVVPPDTVAIARGRTLQIAPGDHRPLTLNGELLTPLFVSAGQFVGFDHSEVTDTPFVTADTTRLLTLDSVLGTGTDLGNLDVGLRGLAAAAGARVAFTTAAVSGAEGDTLQITVVRSGGGPGPFSVDYVATTGTAAAADVGITSGTLVFLEDEVTKTVAVPLVDDVLVEADETFTIDLVNPTLEGVIATPSTLTVTITSDDAPPAAGRPVLVITTPTSAATYATPAASIALAGSAVDDGGVIGVMWSNDRGGSGMATGTTTWAVPQVPLAPGVNVISVTAEDTDGRSTVVTLTVTSDPAVIPAIVINGPTAAPTFRTTAASVTLAGAASDDTGVQQVTWSNNRGGSGTAVGTTAWSVNNVPLAAGLNVITMMVTDDDGLTSFDRVVVSREQPLAPIVVITTPWPATYATACTIVEVRGAVVDANGSDTIASVTWVNDRGGSGAATMTAPTHWLIASVPLQPGANTITVTAADDDGLTAIAVVTVNVTQTPPAVEIVTPKNPLVTNRTQIPLAGTAGDTCAAPTVTWVNDRGGSGTATGTSVWSVANVALQPGQNVITVTATDEGGLTTTDTVTITQQDAPVPNEPPTVTITVPTSSPELPLQDTFSVGIGGTASDDTGIASVTWTSTWNEGEHTAAGTIVWGANIPLEPGGNLVRVTVTDLDGLTATDTVNITMMPAGPIHPPPAITITSPTSPATVNTATIALAGSIVSQDGLWSSGWSNDRGGSGNLTVTQTGSGFRQFIVPQIALQPGVNVITVSATNPRGSRSRSVTVTYTAPAPRVYHFAEGSTGSFFSTDLLFANPNDVAAPVSIRYLHEDGQVVDQTMTLDARSRATVIVDDVPGLAPGGMALVVTSTDGHPLAVERTMRWDASGYGGHTEKASDGAATNWYFAEGSQGFFSTYLLLSNPNDAANTASVQYLIEGGSPVVRSYPLPPRSRRTIDLGQEPAIVNTSFGMIVTFDAPGMAERSMYFGANPLWSGGHGSAGVPATALEWLLAEGATGSFFETFVLVANTEIEPADVTVTFLRSSGPPIERSFVVPPRARLTINPETLDPELINADFATRVVSTRQIVAERAQYWPGPPSEWTEAHNSFGVTTPGPRWALAEGRVGGAEAYQTFILLANPGNVAADVTLTFLREGQPSFTKSVSVPPVSRLTVPVGPDTQVPELTNERFGVRLDSTTPIVVERAMYWNALGQTWAAGTNATATPLP